MEEMDGNDEQRTVVEEGVMIIEETTSRTHVGGTAAAAAEYHEGGEGHHYFVAIHGEEEEEEDEVDRTRRCHQESTTTLTSPTSTELTSLLTTTSGGNGTASACKNVRPSQESVMIPEVDANEPGGQSATRRQGTIGAGRYDSPPVSMPAHNTMMMSVNSSLDFERIVNTYSIQALRTLLVRRYYQLEALPANCDADREQGGGSRRPSNNNNIALCHGSDVVDSSDGTSPTTPLPPLFPRDYDTFGPPPTMDCSVGSPHQSPRTPQQQIGAIPPPPPQETPSPATKNEKKRARSNPYHRSLRHRRFGSNYTAVATSPREQSSSETTKTTKEEEPDMYYTRRKKGTLLGYSGKTATRWFLTCLTGLCTGLTAVVIVWSVDKLVEFRVDFINRAERFDWTSAPGVIPSHNGTPGRGDAILAALATRRFLVFVLFNALLAVTSSAMCLRFAPGAVGSGIPEVKAYLNGVRVESGVYIHLFVVKVLGTILTVSSGLVAGSEGPLVHLGAIIGASMTKTAWIEARIRSFRQRHTCLSSVFGCGLPDMETNVLGVREDIDRENSLYASEGRQKRRVLRTKKSRCCRCSVVSDIIHFLSFFRNDTERRDFVSIGAAAGFSSAFGAPIGGVLFSLEEASSFFALTMLWKTLTATVLATFVIAAYFRDLSRYSVLPIELGKTPNEDVFMDRFGEMPFYVLVGVAGGLLGAGFNNTTQFLNEGRKHLHKSLSERNVARAKLSEVLLLSVFTSAVLFSVPLVALWACREESEGSESVFIEIPGLRHEYNCPPSQFNELGKILFGSREEAIAGILMNPASYDPRSLVLVGVIFYVLMILTFGTALPGGIFMPGVLSGAALGGFAGIYFRDNFIASVSPSTFALLGAASLLAGIQRNTVSLCVILMEGTGQTKILLPLIITIVVARYVGDRFGEGIYEIAMENRGYAFLDHHVKTMYDVVSVSDVMSCPPVVVHPIETAERIESLLVETTHHGFPVVDFDTKKFLGLVRRDQLVALLECGIFVERDHVGEQTNRHSPEEATPVALEASPISYGHRNYSTPFSLLRSNPSLFNLAFHIKDDRFDGRTSEYEEINRTWRDIAVDDPTENNSWLMDNLVVTDEEIFLGRDQSLPNTGPHASVRRRKDTTVTLLNGKLVAFVADGDRKRHVNIEDVMNRGAYVVTEGCPLSKAYSLFTSLGLRHICVLGGKWGGQVVGVITRSNLTREVLDSEIGWSL